MKYLLLFTLSLSLHICSAQNGHLLRIVAYSGNVKLDDVPVNSGQLVSATSQTLEIGKKESYAYVLTPTGYAMKLEQGRYNTADIENLIYNKIYKPVRPKGAVHDGSPPSLFFGINVRSGINDSPTGLLMDDSICLKWKPNWLGRGDRIKPPFKIKFLSVFDDLLYKADVYDYFIEINLRHISAGNVAVLVKIDVKDSEMIMIKFLDDENKNRIKRDLADISTQASTKNVSELLIYFCNGLNLELIPRLEKILKSDTSSFDSDYKNFISLLKTSYELN